VERETPFGSGVLKAALLLGVDANWLRGPKWNARAEALNSSLLLLG